MRTMYNRRAIHLVAVVIKSAYQPWMYLPRPDEAHSQVSSFAYMVGMHKA